MRLTAAPLSDCRPSARALSSAILSALLLGGCAAGAGAGRSSTEVAAADAVPVARLEASCSIRVIAELAAPQPFGPGAPWLTDVAQRANVRLAQRQALGGRFVVLDVSTTERDPGCRAALGRLRNEPLFRSVEVDTLRRAQSR